MILKRLYKLNGCQLILYSITNI